MVLFSLTIKNMGATHAYINPKVFIIAYAAVENWERLCVPDHSLLGE